MCAARCTIGMHGNTDPATPQLAEKTPHPAGLSALAAAEYIAVLVLVDAACQAATAQDRTQIPIITNTCNIILPHYPTTETISHGHARSSRNRVRKDRKLGYNQQPQCNTKLYALRAIDNPHLLVGLISDLRGTGRSLPYYNMTGCMEQVTYLLSATSRELPNTATFRVTSQLGQEPTGIDSPPGRTRCSIVSSPLTASPQFLMHLAPLAPESDPSSRIIALLALSRLALHLSDDSAPPNARHLCAPSAT
ncbi:hypothetical protein BKA56DRAFT_711265 [Ilyonectria sp. MPI-CAGE-AT-0026]|nr:hypothetical protein BKA56DRAFT_711265 [Ilyonectria sp. MPI-CAGE-AT-0026]